MVVRTMNGCVSWCVCGSVMMSCYPSLSCSFTHSEAAFAIRMIVEKY